MKKIFLTVLAVLFAAVSCKKAVDDGSDIVLDGYTTFNVDTEQIDIVSGQSYKGTWPSGSSIGVFSDKGASNVEYFLKRSGIGQDEAVFYGPVVEGESFLAYYPYSEDVELEDGLLPCNLASDQEYSASADATSQFLKYCGTVVASSDEDKLLEFLYPFGMIAVQICFDEVLTVRNMSIFSNGQAISGRMLVDEDVDVFPSSVSSDRIALAFAEPVSSRDAKGNITTFYFVLPPAEYEAKSLVLSVDAVEGAMTVMLKKITVERVRGVNFPITSVEVSASDLPEFRPVDGYLE